MGMVPILVVDVDTDRFQSFIAFVTKFVLCVFLCRDVICFVLFRLQKPGMCFTHLEHGKVWLLIVYETHGTAVTDFFPKVTSGTIFCPLPFPFVYFFFRFRVFDFWSFFFLW